ncbi:MAG: hypothetical protein E6Q97_12410 [Desulfurellales bacterium]|nr:MAG: hypothetical protein E6Q97_12410 [Desulfurellales bacterium]
MGDLVNREVVSLRWRSRDVFGAFVTQGWRCQRAFDGYPDNEQWMHLYQVPMDTPEEVIIHARYPLFAGEVDAKDADGRIVFYFHG